MSIADMKPVLIVGPLDDTDIALRICCESGVFHPENAIDRFGGMTRFDVFHDENPYINTYNGMQDLNSKIKYNLNEYDPGNFKRLGLSLNGSKEFLYDFEKEFNEINNKIDFLKNSVNEHEELIQQLSHILKLDIDLDNLFTFEFVKFRFGRMPRFGYEKLSRLSDISAYFFPTVIADDYVWGLYMAPRSEIEQTDSLFTGLHFKRMRVSGKVEGTPKRAYEEMEKQLSEFKNELEEQTKTLKSYIAKNKEIFCAYYNKLKSEAELFDLRKYAAHSEKTFALSGWIPANKYDSFQKLFSKEDTIQCMDGFENAEDLSPPTLLKNPFFFKPFELFVNMYGVPSHNEFDPTPLVAITYTLFFGMMFGDLGQGFILALAGFLIWKIKKIPFGGVLLTIGFSSMAFGAFYNSIFGYEGVLPFNGFSPMENINVLLLSAIGIGSFLIVVSMLINIAIGIKQRNPKKWMFDPNGVAGLILYVYVLTAVVLTMTTEIKALNPVFIILFIVLPILMILFRDPLAKLAQRKKDWLPHNIFEYILENFFEMFEVLLSYLTNTVSFVRVGAFALSHFGMMLAVFILAGASTNILVIIIGNTFVICLEGLIVGIQVLRLEYYELFNRFFSGDGHEFKPLTIEEIKK